MRITSKSALASLFSFGIGLACFTGGARAVGTIYSNVDITSFTPVTLGPGGGIGAEAVDPNAVYSNVTNGGTSALPNGGGTTVGTTTFSDMIVDDLNATHGGTLTKFSFSIVNFNAGTVAVQSNVRFYDDAAGQPGNLLGGFNFNPINLGASSGGVFSLTIPAASQFPIPSKVWAGVFFTGSSVAQVNNFAQILFNPANVGSTADLDFDSGAAGGPFVT
ncbi:MAG TPA: hypothetical protein VH518_21550, partial [Tepidisphaeraceae bacterium]